MGNIAYVTTKKHVKSYDVFSLLEKINEKRFGGKMVITQGAKFAWDISHPDIIDSLWFHRDSAKKIACKHPHDPWMRYVFIVYQEELGLLTEGIMSDEGVSERWSPNPNKYPNYKSWISLLYSRTEKMFPAHFENIVREELACAPKGMENY